LGGLEGPLIWRGFGQAATASLVMSLGLWAWSGLSENWPIVWVVAGGLLLGAGVYALVILAAGVEEINGLIRALRQALQQVFQ
jgi:hypothetical protein